MGVALGRRASLMAAPDGTLKPEEMLQLFELLLGSGLDIATMNLIRKRFTRWSAGRLCAALSNARTRNFIVSNVIGDDLAAIGSGPCSPDPSTATRDPDASQSAELWDRMLRLAAKARGDRGARSVPRNTQARRQHLRERGAQDHRQQSRCTRSSAARAKEFGYEPRILGTALAGEAAHVGRRSSRRR